MTPRARLRRAARRGFSTVPVMLEATAVALWFVVAVLGERLVADATRARRGVEDATEQEARLDAAGSCEGGAGVAGASSRVGAVGSPVTAGSVAIQLALGLGGEKTFSIYTEPFRDVTATSTSPRVTGHRLVGGKGYEFSAMRSQACREPSKDKPQTSLQEYRSTIFARNLQGY